MRNIGRLLSLFLILALAVGLLGVSAAASGEPGSAPGGTPGGAPGGEPGGPSGDVAAATDTEILTLEPETVDELVIGPEGYEFTTDMNVGHLEIDPAAEITAPYPVLVFFGESDSVENGAVLGNVQFVSDYDEAVAIVHTNDVHGHIEVEPYVKGLADQLKASGDYSLVLTVSAGDVYGGGEAVAGSYNGEFIPAIMDPVYDVFAPGNNDYTITNFATQNLLVTSLFEHTQVICANLETKEDGLPLEEYAENYDPKIGAELFDELYEKVTTAPDGSLDLSGLELKDLPGDVSPYPYTTTFTTDNGTVIGLFGLSTVGGASEKELDCLGSVEQARACVDALRADGADVVICVGHTGWLGEDVTGGSSNDTNSWQVANQVTGLDAFIDGHTHSIINQGQGVLVGSDPTFVNQAQSFGYCIGRMILYLKDGEVVGVQGDVINDMSGITPDADEQAMVDMALAKVKEDFGKPIAHTDYFLNGERLSAANEGGSARGNETNLGDLMTDVLLDACSKKMGVDYDFIFYQGYWLRASIEAGDITMESIQSVFSNPTVLYYDTFTAQDVLDLVTYGLTNLYPEKEGQSFYQYSGLRVTYTYDAGTGTPVTIEVGDTLVYDANNGGIQVGGDWTCEVVGTMTGGEIDNYTGDQHEWICHDKTEVQDMVIQWFQEHTADDYTVYPNTVAPAGRVAQADG